MTASVQRIITTPRRALRRADAALYAGVSPSKFDDLVADGRLPKAVRVDGCLLWDIRALDAALDRLLGTGPTVAADDQPNPWDAR